MKKNSIILAVILVFIVLIVSYVIFKNNNILKNTNNPEQMSESNVNIYDSSNKGNEDISNVKYSDNREKNPVNSQFPIFMYHNISNDTGTDKYVNNYLSPEKFEEQIKYIHDNKFQTIFIEELPYLCNYEKPVILTFDDGYENFYNNAYPILKKYNQKAVLNVITQYIDKPNYVTSNEIIEMKESGLVSIQSHTQKHSDLSKISSETLQKELKSSKEDLKSMFDIESTTICYPSGRYNDNVIKNANDYYKYGLTTKNAVYNSKIDDLLRLPRVRVSRDISMKSFIYYLNMSSITEI